VAAGASKTGGDQAAAHRSSRFRGDFSLTSGGISGKGGTLSNKFGGWEELLLASHKSAEKRSRQTGKKTLRNVMIKSRTKARIKSVLAALETKDKDAVQAALAEAVPAIAKAGAKGVFPKKTASRKISRLTRRVNAAHQ